MDRKAMPTINLLVALITLLVIAFILITFNYLLTSELKNKSDTEACRLSVIAQAQNKYGGKSIVPLECPRRKIKIYEDKTDLAGKKSREYEHKKLSQNDANRIFAEELRLCWYKMLEGNANVFEQSYFFSDSKYYTCLICSEIEFDDKIKGRTYVGLAEYLNTNNIPNGNISYFEYLVRSQKEVFAYLPYGQYNPWFEGTTGKIQEDKINTNEKYIVYFLAMKPVWFVEKTGAYLSTYYIGLGKEDKLKRECEALVN